ncbi:MAG: DUF364 domain-containing protein [Candidatus Zixiibacteriota bacterium]
MDLELSERAEAVMDIFAKLREQMLRKTSSFQDEDFAIRGLWKTELFFKPNIFERVFRYTFVLAQTVGQGCSYCDQDVLLDHDLIGKDSREIITQTSCTGIAVLDSIFSSIPKQPQQVHELQGDSIGKTSRRNSIILNEAEMLLKGRSRGEARIVNVGVVGDLIRKLRDRNYAVFATDFDKAVVGRSLHGVNIEGGSKTLSYVRDCDIAIITGMTLATHSLDCIVETAHACGTKLLMFAETGANFAEEYCNTIGIDVVVSEPFPFYIFQGRTRIEVYRR